MGEPQPPVPVALVVGLLAASDALLTAATGALTATRGAVVMTSEPTAWTHTDYYRDELGPGARRQYLVFADLIDPAALAPLKLDTNALERRWAGPHGRQVNVDPGYLTATKLVLASTKDAGHRLYLGQGIYAEVTLAFHHGGFQPLAHTYPDYATAPTRTFFAAARQWYLSRLRHDRAQPRAIDSRKG